MGLRAIKPRREDVESLYRLLLDRAPDSESAIAQWLEVAPSLDWLVTQFLQSEEFKNKNPQVNSKAKPVDASRLKELINELADRHPQRELYQPVYGIKIDHGGPVQRECIERCKLVIDAFAGLPIQNMTVLDVGCNMGYVSFYLSECFSRVTGLEYDGLLHEYCVELASVIDSPVEFRKFDFFSEYKSLAGQHDICLLFSVIHYLVAGNGREEAKLILNDIVSSFDFVIIELSSSKDYEYMPDEPSEMLEKLTEVDVTLLGVSEKNARPIYFLKKKR